MSRKVKVRMKSTSAGPDGVYMRGQEVSESIKEAEQLVSGGYAEYLEKPEKSAENTNEPDQNQPENDQVENSKQRKKG